ncbi:monooxygenase [Aspergillus karnatakaensis]|uniref:flavin-containing monooxygenase n=1 Tax=Aspergillus karnatakaensis TaxID=1810916 RepID=UPI003CCDA0C8
MAAEEHRVCIIVGAGFGGIVQACTLLREDILFPHEIQILERSGGYGGVWWKHTYPGAACDIASEIYSISWAPNPFWTRRLAGQPEIQQYLEKVALEHHLDTCTAFNTDVLQAEWDEERFLWIVRTKNLENGIDRMWTCSILVSAAGLYSVPSKPDIPGIDTFTGRQWHTVDWPKEADLKGKKVGIIGTGPSAAQLIPHIVQDVSRLYIYQRTPTFCVPRLNPETSSLKRWAFATFPVLGRLARWTRYIHWNAATEGTWLQKAVVAVANNHLNRQVHVEEIRDKLRPKDKFGCKHALVLSDYYPVFNEPHVELVTDPVTGLTNNGITSVDTVTGIEESREVDVLIWGTGFRTQELGGAFPARGRKGLLLVEKYQSDMSSLYGIAVDDFPNFFNLLGPNSLGFDIHFVELLETQARYVGSLAKYLQARQAEAEKKMDKCDGRRYAVMAKADRLREWTLSLREGQAKHPAAIASCRSHYKSKDGQVHFYPYGWTKYRKLVSEVDFGRDWTLLSTNKD